MNKFSKICVYSKIKCANLGYIFKDYYIFKILIWKNILSTHEQQEILNNVFFSIVRNQWILKTIQDLLPCQE